MRSFIRLVAISDLLRAEYRFLLLLIVDRGYVSKAVRSWDVTHSALPAIVALATLRVAFITFTVHTLALDRNVLIIIV